MAKKRTKVEKQDTPKKTEQKKQNLNIVVPGSFHCRKLGKGIFKGVYVAKDKEEYDIVVSEIKRLFG